MKKYTILFTIFLFFTIVPFYGQYLIKNNDDLEALKQTPLERLFISHTSSLLFTGEYMYYSLYCFNSRTLKLSKISSLAYVELVGENGKVVFSHKIKLDKGLGYGDFFIPVSVPSGNYKLIGYTQWMKNGGITYFFQDDLAIINPYRTDQEAILSIKNFMADAMNTDMPLVSMETSRVSKDNIIALKTNGVFFEKRAKVTLRPKNFKGPLGYGNYSISVRKMDTISKPLKSTPLSFSSQYSDKDYIIPQKVNDTIYLPEQRGELFSGKVSLKNPFQSAVGKKVIISIPGKDFQLNSALTDTSGNFYTYFKKPYKESTVIVQIVGDDRTNYQIEKLEKGTPNYDALTFNRFIITPNMKKMIVDRSLHNQIENGYFSVKPDTIISIDKNDPFNGAVPKVYTLDDFTRFPTLRETLVEIVDHAWVKKLEKDTYSFWVRQEFESQNIEFTSYPPLVFMDGLMIQDHNSLLEYKTKNVKTISVLRNESVFLSKKYQGMVVIETINGDYTEQLSSEKYKKIELTGLQPEKNYFNQKYNEGETMKTDRIPDYRYQLLWEPHVNLDTDGVAFEFFTSDVSGDYEISLEGFTTYGKPISAKKIISVK